MENYRFATPQSFVYICTRCGALIPDMSWERRSMDGRKRAIDPRQIHDQWHLDLTATPDP